MNTMENEGKKIIDLREIVVTIWNHRKTLYKVWGVVFLLSCIWIFPQPRFYTCEVKLAPEAAGEDIGGGLASIASSFGFNLGSLGSSDAIYPTLYPDLFESPAFITSLFNVKVQTADGKLSTDYYTYIKNHQKKNYLLYPFYKCKKFIVDLFESKESIPMGASNGVGINPFRMSKKDFELVTLIQDNIQCSNDKKTDVTTILVKDQDPLVSALLADSISARLQEFVIQYRTKKSRADVAYYKVLCDSAKHEYDSIANYYCHFVESHKNISTRFVSHQEELLRDEMEMKKQAYMAFNSQVQAMNAKVQERTPVFTVLKSATVPIKPAGPKRLIFVLGMLILSSIVFGIYLCRHMFVTKKD